MFILSRDRYSRPWASLFPSPLWKIIASKISAWKIGERALKVKRWENRQPGYRRSVGRSIVPLARRPSYRGRKATRNFVIHVSFIFYLKKIPFFSLQTKVVSFSLSLSFLLNSNRRSKSFPKEEKTCCCCCSLFTNIEISPLRIRFPLSRDIYREKINRTARIFPFFFFFSLSCNDSQVLRMSGRGTNRNWFVFLSSAATF